MMAHDSVRTVYDVNNQCQNDGQINKTFYFHVPNESDNWRLYTPVRRRNKLKTKSPLGHRVYKGPVHRLVRLHQ